jgi:hypothetical protein
LHFNLFLALWHRTNTDKKMKKLLSFILGLTLLYSCTGSELPLQSIRLLDRAKMTLIEPEGFKRVESKQNKKMNWDLAYVHPHLKFEVRYAIHPMDNILKKYQEHESKLDSGGNIVHPNRLYITTFKTTLFNITDGQSPSYTIFSSAAAKNEFNADWGATAAVNVGKDFEKEYKYCYFVFIHKDNIGDSYIFCLADDLKLLNDEMVKIIHNLKFQH